MSLEGDVQRCDAEAGAAEERHLRRLQRAGRARGRRPAVLKLPRLGNAGMNHTV